MQPNGLIHPTNGRRYEKLSRSSSKRRYRISVYCATTPKQVSV